MNNGFFKCPDCELNRSYKMFSENTRGNRYKLCDVCRPHRKDELLDEIECYKQEFCNQGARMRRLEEVIILRDAEIEKLRLALSEY